MSELSYLEKLLDGAEVEWLTAAEIFNIKNGYTPSKAKKEFWEDGNIPWFRLEDIRTNGRELNDSIMHVNQAGVKGNLFPKDSIFMSTTATIGEFALVKIPHLTNQQITNFSLTSRFKGIIDIRYLFHRFHHFGEWCKENANKSGGLSIIGIKKLSSYKFPIPCPDNPEKSLAIQSEIVRVLDKFTALTAALTAELTMRKKQYNYYRDQLLCFDEAEVEWKTLADVAILRRGRVMSKGYLEQNAGDYPVYSSQTARNGMIGSIDTYDFDGEFISWTTDGANAGTVFYRTGKFSITNVCGLIKIHENYPISYKYLYYWLSIEAQKHVYSGMGNPKLMSHQVEKITVPIPFPASPEKSMLEQQRIVGILDKLEAITFSLTEGLPREIELRQKQYEYYRDLLFSFPRPETASN